MDYSPRGCKESDTTKQPTHTSNFRQNKTSLVTLTTLAMSLILKTDKDTIKKKITDQFTLEREEKYQEVKLEDNIFRCLVI